jgi:hypothetical protein
MDPFTQPQSIFANREINSKISSALPTQSLPKWDFNSCIFGEPRNAVKLTYRVNWGELKFKSIFKRSRYYRQSSIYLKYSCDGSSVSTLFRCQLLDKHGTIYIDEKKSQHQLVE